MDCVRLFTPVLQVLLVVALTITLSTAALLPSKRGMSERFAKNDEIGFSAIKILFCCRGFHGDTFSDG